jgi:beta-aspartyl-dipeptidase (metallo-type)
MFTILKDAECFSPDPIGRKDILICGDKILKIADPAGLAKLYEFGTVIDCSGLLAFPGIIDQHIHLIGGGGENGPASRIEEISLNEILLAGVGTVVGVLGFDSYTKSLKSLLAKANTLEAMGLTAYIYTGSYAIPTVTITGTIAEDLILIDKIIGTGEIAISDYRSSQPTYNEFAQLSAQSNTAGLISGKAGVVHIHVGDGKAGLRPLIKLLEETDLPREMFVPTHMNRNEALFAQALEYCANGGNIDLTAGETKGVSVPEAIKKLREANMDLSRVTISSDANGSSGTDVTRISSLLEDMKNAIQNENIPAADMFRFVTENVARILKLYPTKGTLREASDADILVMDRAYTIRKLFCRGKLPVDSGRVVR